MDEDRRFEFSLALGGLLVGIGVAFLQIFPEVPTFSWVMIALGCAIFVWQGIVVFGWKEHVTRHQRLLGVVAIASLTATTGYLIGRWQFQPAANPSPSSTPWVSIVMIATPIVTATPAASATPITKTTRSSPKNTVRKTTPRVLVSPTPSDARAAMKARVLALRAELIALLADHYSRAAKARTAEPEWLATKSIYLSKFEQEILSVLRQLSSFLTNRVDRGVIGDLLEGTQAADPQKPEDIDRIAKELDLLARGLNPGVNEWMVGRDEWREKYGQTPYPSPAPWGLPLPSQ